jgi:hypothetical protein
MRFLALLLGPPLLVSGAWCLTLGGAPEDSLRAPHDPVGAMSESVERPAGPGADELAPRRGPSPDAAVLHIETACRDVAESWRARSAPRFSVVVRAPYVLAGDLDEAQLLRWHDEIVRPVEKALGRQFFDARPERPIVLLLFGTTEAFRAHAVRHDRTPRDCYSGYFLREERRIVVDASTGAGTLAHELCHALALSDFPRLPEWFDEGLASVFEECEFDERGRILRGLPNWRASQLRAAQGTNVVRPIGALVAGGSFRPEALAFDYAQARALCLWLQDEGLLEVFYRKFRGRVAHDPTGLDTLRDVCGCETTDDLDAAFRAWLDDRGRMSLSTAAPHATRP